MLISVAVVTFVNSLTHYLPLQTQPITLQLQYGMDIVYSLPETRLILGSELNQTNKWEE